MTAIFSLLTLQAVLGAIDNLWHHEITERLPARRSAAPELALHALRELIYAAVFLGLGLVQPHGFWAMLLGALLCLEVIITLADFLIEDRTRRLPGFERILHTVLALTFGAFLARLAPVLLDWAALPTALPAVRHGFTNAFVVFGIGVLLWSMRNFIAVVKLRRPPEWVRNPVEAGVADKPRTVLITGATGFVGGHLVRSLVARGEQIIVLTRRPDVALDRFGPQVRIVSRLEELGPATRVHAVVNLAGAPILGFPWTRRRRRKLLLSRVETTRAVIALIGRLAQPPAVLVSASAIGYYGVRGDEPLDENAAPADIFQSRLCQQWEAAALAAESAGVRVVRLRIGLVLGRDGGALPQLMLPARLGLAAILGSGRHWMSWIHIDDLVRLIGFAIDTPGTAGVLNAVAPHPATQRRFQRALTNALRRPLWLRMPSILLRLALGEMSQLLVDGQRVLPIRATSLGFRYHYRTIEQAMVELCTAPLQQARRAQVYFNGDCPVCQAEMSRYARDSAGAGLELQFVDCKQRPDDLERCGLRIEHLERRVYLRNADGRIVSGFPAMLALWRTIPAYRLLARMLALPVIQPFCSVLYDQAVAPSLSWWAHRQATRRTAQPHRRPRPRPE